jgi:hypothetical protein
VKVDRQASREKALAEHDVKIRLEDRYENIKLVNVAHYRARVKDLLTELAMVSCPE